MKKKGLIFIQKMLGDIPIKALKKTEISGGMYKKNTRTVLDEKEIKIALQIVPRTILTYLFNHLKWKKEGDVIDLPLPFEENALLHLNKLGPDNYNGEVIKDGKILIGFKHRSLPGIGLIILTTFELYDIAMLDEIRFKKEDEPKQELNDLQEEINRRLSMNEYIQQVVERKISEREAINKIIQERLSRHLSSMLFHRQIAENKNEENAEMGNEKKSKLRQFLESREKRQYEPVKLDKKEIQCPDCGETLHKGDDKDIKLCICYGQHMNKSIKIQKKENGQVRLKFPKNFGIDNVEMLLDVLKKK